VKAFAPIVEGAPPPRHNGVRRIEGDDDVWYRWAVFSRKVVEAERGYTINVFDLDDIGDWVGWLTGWSHSYSGAGRYFSDTPFMRIQGDRILITQRCGYDV
jgi:hypothetical protein